MSWSLLVTLLGLGLVGGFLSGLLSLAIFMIPLLLYVPPLFGVGYLTMKEVAAVSIVQVISASLTGVLVHNKNKYVSRQLLIVMGIMNAAGYLAGSLYSQNMKSSSLLAIFTSLAIIAAAVMLIPRREKGGDIAPEDVKFNIPLAAAVSLAIGGFSGMVSAPGAFLYIPVMIYLFGIPTRIVIGTTLGIVLFGAIAGTIGKMVAGQIIWPYAIALVIGTIPGALIGSQISKKVDTRYLRLAIAIIIAVTGLRMWYQIITER